MYDEVEELRERLGLDAQEPITIEGSMYRRGLSIQKDKSLNRVLKYEVDWLFQTTFKLVHVSLLLLL